SSQFSTSDELSKSSHCRRDESPWLRKSLRSRRRASSSGLVGQWFPAGGIRIRRHVLRGDIEGAPMKTIAFFNNKGGVGKTSLVYHLAFMFAERGISVVAADLDPQANLTSMFLDDDRMEAIWDSDVGQTVYSALDPLLEGTGDVAAPHVERIGPRLGLVAGDLSLSRAEDELSSQWAECLDGKPRAFRVISAFWRIIEIAAKKREAEIVLMDVGPNLGAINRAALIAANYVVIPLAPDLFSLQGLNNLGPTLRRWRFQWKKRTDNSPSNDLSLPPGEIQPLGYIVLQHGVRVSRPVKAYQRWISQIPSTYRKAVLNEKNFNRPPATQDDPYCLAMLKHYRSLMPLAMEARKPIFYLKPADGAIGAHVSAVNDCYRDFLALAKKIAAAVGLSLE
ncbi:MAG TPA: AAA family ATPase, partial [Roseiarcus sp.]